MPETKAAATGTNGFTFFHSSASTLMTSKKPSARVATADVSSWSKSTVDGMGSRRTVTLLMMSMSDEQTAYPHTAKTISGRPIVAGRRLSSAGEERPEPAGAFTLCRCRYD